MKHSSCQSVAAEGKEKDYSTYDLLHGPPRPGDKIAYKVCTQFTVRMTCCMGRQDQAIRLLTRCVHSLQYSTYDLLHGPPRPGDKIA